MGGNSSAGWQVAPHGIVAFAGFAALLIIIIKMTGFSVVGAVKVG